jgi:hypothetical protein
LYGFGEAAVRGQIGIVVIKVKIDDQEGEHLSFNPQLALFGHLPVELTRK